MDWTETDGLDIPRCRPSFFFTAMPLRRGHLADAPGPARRMRARMGTCQMLLYLYLAYAMLLYNATG